MIEVSIVSGTYNRLDYLRQMVGSVRNSVGPVKYEIVLVDGGSTDGTIEWCKEQPDITIIEQGELLGAVKAFNEGAYAAKGRYVLLANDDIGFVNQSILRSWTYMEDFKTIGVGCFYQDRNGRSWHVETMPAIDTRGPLPKQIAVPYGQVCIVPKWLGDHVGWWGDYLRTYGGDNELSCNVIELGYQILPIPGAYIHDFSGEVDDELRQINNGDPQIVIGRGKMHPDSAKWYTKWTYKGSPRGLTGPELKDRPTIENKLTDKSLRILYAPIYEPGNTLQKSTKTGLRDALSRCGVVTESDYMNEGLPGLKERACNMCPDIFVLQIQDANVFTKHVIQILKEDHPYAQFISWNGDYHPDNLYDPGYIEVMQLMDHAGFAVASIKNRYFHLGIKWFYWQIGYEESYGEPDKTTKRHDVVFLGNGYSEQRQDLGRFLHSYRGSKIDVGLYGSWPNGWSLGSNLYNFNAGRKIYRAAKIAISDQQWPEATGYVSNRLFQAMAAGGCVVLQEYFDGMEEYLGLKDGEHLLTWKTHDALDRRIEWCLQYPEESEEIARKGHEFMLKHHSFDVRVRELMNVLGR